MIGVRVLIGRVSTSPMYRATGAIGTDSHNSYHRGDAYVIRRSCQALPCFLIYYENHIDIYVCLGRDGNISSNCSLRE
jgi:hypothetical protein